jgi:hypothetical protein
MDAFTCARESAMPPTTPPVPAQAPYEVHFWPTSNNALVMGWVPE